MLPPRWTRCQLHLRAPPSWLLRKSIALYSRWHPAATNDQLLCKRGCAVNATARARAPMRRSGCNRIDRRRGATFLRQSRSPTRRVTSAHARARRQRGAKCPGRPRRRARSWRDRNDNRFHGGRAHRRVSIIILLCRSSSPWRYVRGASANVSPWRARPPRHVGTFNNA